MKYKIVNSPVFEREDEKIAAVLAYLKALLKADWATISWGEIKKNDPNFFYTIDTIFIIWRDILRANPEEFQQFSKLIQKNKGLRKAFLEIIEDEDSIFMSFWETIDLTRYPTFSASESTTLAAMLEIARKERDELKKTILNSPWFNSLSSHCPLLFEELQDKKLKELLSTSQSSLILLNNDNIAKRFATLLDTEVLLNLFSFPFVPAQKKQFTMNLLNYCATHNSAALGIFFKKLKSMPDSEHIKVIKVNLDACGDQLLVFFKTYPRLFLSYVSTVEDLKVLLRFSADHIADLVILLKEPQIAKWIGQQIVEITAELLKNANAKKVSRVIDFINQYGDGNETFSSLLTIKVRLILANVGNNSNAEINAVFSVLHSQAVRTLMRFSVKEISVFLSDKRLDSFTDRLLSQDEALWTMFITYLSENFQTSRPKIPQSFPLIYARFNIRSRLQLFKITDFYKSSLSVLEAFVATNTAEWSKVKQSINASGNVQGSGLHPVIALRLNYDAIQREESFLDHLFNHYLAGDKLCLTGDSLIRDPQDLQLFSIMASGEQILRCLELLVERQKVTPHASQSATMHLRNYFKTLVRYTMGSLYGITKLVATINVSNIHKWFDLFKETEMRAYFDGDMLLKALLLLPSPERVQVVSRLATQKELVIKLFFVVNNENRYFLLETLLNDKTIAEKLFQNFSKQDFLRLLNILTVPMISVLFKTIQCASIRANLLEVLQGSLEQIVNPDLLLFIFTPENGLIEDIAKHINLKQFVVLVTSKVASQLWMRDLLGCLHFFPLKALVHDKDSFDAVICGSPLLGAKLLQEWVGFDLEHFLPEKLIQLMLQDQNKEIFGMYLAIDNSCLLTMVHNMLPGLDSSVRDKLMSTFPILLTTLPYTHEDIEPLKINLRDGARPQIDIPQLSLQVINGDNSSLASVTRAPLQTIRDKFYQGLLDNRIINAIERVCMSVRNGTFPLHAKEIPVTLLLTDQFCEQLDQLLQETPRLVCDYLLSFPRKFFKGLINIIDHSQENGEPSTSMEQVVFISILQKLKFILLSCLDFLFKNLVQQRDASLEILFLKLLYVACENHPHQIQNWLSHEPYNKLVLSCLRDHINKYEKCNFEGEIVLRLLLLREGLRPIDKQYQQDPRIHNILKELVCQPNHFTERQSDFICKTFTAQFLLAINNKQLTAYFIRMMHYSQHLIPSDIARLINDHPDLKILIELYPHNQAGDLQVLSVDDKLVSPQTTVAALLPRLNVSRRKPPINLHLRAIERFEYLLMENKLLGFFPSAEGQKIIAAFRATDLSQFEAMLEATSLYTILPQDELPTCLQGIGIVEQDIPVIVDSILKWRALFIKIYQPEVLKLIKIETGHKIEYVREELANENKYVDMTP